MSYLHPISAAFSDEYFSKTPDVAGLKGKSVLITGGASGLGAAAAKRLGEIGAIVTIADIQEELGAKYTKELEGYGYDVQFVHTDVTSWSSQINAFKAAIARSQTGKNIDVVVAAAGLMGNVFMHPSDELPSLEKDPSEPSWRTVDVNLKGMYYTTMLAKNYLRLNQKAPAEDKSLVLFCSTAAYVDVPLLADYVASKAGIRGMFKAIRGSLASQGIRVNTINPWIMATPLAQSVVPFFEANKIPMGRIEDVVDAVVRCAADKSIFGRAICVGAERSSDFGDDIDGLDAGPASKRLVENEAKGFWEMLTAEMTKMPS